MLETTLFPAERTLQQVLLPTRVLQVFADEEDMGSKSKTGRSPVPRVSRNKVAGDQVRRCLPVLGMLAASTATTALAASTLTPVAGFALFVLLLGGLSLVNLVVVGSGGASGHGCQWDDDDGDVSLA